MLKHAGQLVNFSPQFEIPSVANAYSTGVSDLHTICYSHTFLAIRLVFLVPTVSQPWRWRLFYGRSFVNPRSVREIVA